jgi:Uma2 family endonuclease
VSAVSRDRGEKLRAYQACPSVDEYVMVSTHHQEVEVYHREDANRWTLTRYTHGQVLTLASVGLTLSLTDIYEDTDVSTLASVLAPD